MTFTIKCTAGTQSNSNDKTIGDTIATGVQTNVQYLHTKPRKRFSYLTLSREDQCLHEALEVETHVRHGRAGTHAVLRLRTLLVRLCEMVCRTLLDVLDIRMHTEMVYVQSRKFRISHLYLGNLLRNVIN